jgi:signal transduction histidine kinase
LFCNLISNALKYSKDETPPVIKIFPEDAGEDAPDVSAQSKKYCRIYVRDNGIGFDQKYGEQVFEMFKRLHNPSRYEGTGIGLALCKQIVEKHRGYISVLSKPGEGTTFIVSLPLHMELHSQPAVGHVQL